MEKKRTTKTIEVDVYVTSDGKEFERENEAEEYELKLWYETEMKSRELYKDENVYILINSRKEYLGYKRYNKDIEWYAFDDNEIWREIFRVQYPILIKYDLLSYVTIVEESEYNFHKKICEMYEETKKEIKESYNA